MIKKWLAIGIILLFVGTCIVPAIAQDTEKSQSSSRGNWLYVGGSGPGNYTRIQDAIDNASDGDIVYVYHGTYFENVNINKSISILGEERNTTIVIGYFFIIHYKVTIDNFTIRNGSSWQEYSLFISSYCIISNCIVSNYWNIGIGIYPGSNNIIQSCFVYNCIRGLEMIGYEVYRTGNNTISSCNFSNNDLGIIYETPENNTIIHNNFFKNKKHVRFYDYISGYIDSNYWDNWKGFGHKIIIGFLPLKIFNNPSSLYSFCIVPHCIFDLHPAQEPYDIPKMS
jgi:parallel beta-helix repeat protein